TSQVLALRRDGLLSLSGFDAPGELMAGLVGTAEGRTELGVARSLQELRRSVAGSAVFDGPEYTLARGGAVERFARDVWLAARLVGLRAVVNLNAAEPPPWAG